MKTLKDHTILYDEVCPLCQAYTSAFVKTGMLENSGRIPYQHLSPGMEKHVDLNRAKDEIALVNTKTGEVHYGIDSLFRIIGHAFPLLRIVFRFPPFAWSMKILYKFISYNRRIIMPSSGSTVTEDPSFHRVYRAAYLVFTWIFSAFILHRFSFLLTGIIPSSGFYRELLICGGQMLWQGMIIRFVSPTKTWDYLGNLMTISFAGSLLLTVAIVLSGFILLPPFFYAIVFLCVVSLMLIEHMRRSSILKLGFTLTLTWILYRIILLILIF